MREIEIEDVENLFNFFKECSNGYAFRGHLSSEWKLESSLVRNTFTTDNKTYHDLEDTAITDFKSKFNIYGELKDKPTSRLGWLSIMQHYGAPTRLIDFTTSPFVALGFIIENLNPKILSNHENRFSIFALNYTNLNKILLNKLKTNNILEKDCDVEQLYIDAEKVSDFILDAIDSKSIYFMMNEPLFSNKRIDRQNGTFLISNKFLEIEKFLSQDEYSSIDLTKILIPSILYKDIFMLLRKMNINLKNIYGDLDGLGKSIRSNLLFYSHRRTSSIG